ncbi:MAG: hypothetical protein GEU73_13960 [Chloroflexi bacterium]|nr:hypothetical protein [Chloroflexota bacterium]
MCFVALLLEVNAHVPVVVAANRDEARARPSAPPHRWPGEPALWAGQDRVAGGTWLGVNSTGLLVAITNRREGENDPDLPSRGLLCVTTLRQTSLDAARAYVAEELRTRRYNPFNLLCVQGTSGWAATWRGDVVPLEPGVHVLTNRGELDDDRLAMVRHARGRLAQLDLTTASIPALLQGLGQLCADTSGPEPICRPGGDRGTVSSSLIALDTDGSIAAYWHAEGPPSEHRYLPLDVTEEPAAPAHQSMRS